MYLNKVFLFGNLTRDPELKSLPSGSKVVSFGLATNRVWKDKNSVKQEDTTFHNIVAFGKQAETITQYLKKGRGVFIEGRISNRSWDDKNSGEKKYRSEVILENFQFGPNSGGGQEYQKQSANTSKPAQSNEEIDTIEYPEEDINPEDIPF